jgi:hypothetical protein
VGRNRATYKENEKQKGTPSKDLKGVLTIGEKSEFKTGFLTLIVSRLLG